MTAVSAAGVLVRLAPDAHPLALGFWRTALVALVLAPFARRIPLRDAGWVGLAGVLLALHFWAWFASLHLTSVLRSTVLVCLTPLWAGIAEAVVLKSPPPRHFWWGVAIAVGCVGALAGAGGRGDLRGDGLALLGGALGASYLVVGRVVRPRVGIATYGALVCASAAVALFVLALAVGVPLLGHSRGTWGVIVAMAVGPQLLGHIGFNYAVRYVTAATVGAVILLEPVGATILAGLVLGERPGAREWLAGLGILVGVGVAILPRR